MTTTDIIIRLAVTTVLATLIGMEREWHEKPAGIRTNVMVGLGATVMTLASIHTPALWPDVRPIDPGRLAAQIVSGIGFIGAGAILRSEKGAVVGLTTAATMWVVAGMGIAVGFGLYREAIATTAFVFFTFFILGRLVRKIRKDRGLRDDGGHEPLHEDQVSMEGLSAGDRE